MIDFKLLRNSFSYAAEGVRYVFKNDQNMRIHCITALLVVSAALFFKVTPFEMGILGVMIVLVITTEMINSSIEKMTDLITKEYRTEAKIAKDVAAGMVLLAALGSILVGIFIFVPYIIRFLNLG
jgi:diacylglycerol kinase